MKTYDCFTFFNELDLLEIRLNVLKDKIDYFVLVEAAKTHSGAEKPLYFNENKERFRYFSDKIIHVIVDDMPPLINGNRWKLENFQREAIMRGLISCEKDDLIIISDLDEIPNIESVGDLFRRLKKYDGRPDYLFEVYSKFKKIMFTAKFNIGSMKIGTNKIIGFKQNLYYYYLNGFIKNDWIGSRAVLFEVLNKEFGSSPQRIRNTLPKNIVKHGGWHFSYLLSPEQIVSKIRSFAHSEYDKPDYTDVDLIKKRIKDGQDIFLRKDKISYVKIDCSYPKYIEDNQNKFREYIN